MEQLQSHTHTHSHRCVPRRADAVRTSRRFDLRIRALGQEGAVLRWGGCTGSIRSADVVSDRIRSLQLAAPTRLLLRSPILASHKPALSLYTHGPSVRTSTGTPCSTAGWSWRSPLAGTFSLSCPRGTPGPTMGTPTCTCALRSVRVIGSIKHI